MRARSRHTTISALSVIQDETEPHRIQLGKQSGVCPPRKVFFTPSRIKLAASALDTPGSPGDSCSRFVTGTSPALLLLLTHGIWSSHSELDVLSLGSQGYPSFMLRIAVHTVAAPYTALKV